MKCVFRARDAIEAHMLADLLDQVGIMAQVQGDMLQGLSANCLRQGWHRCGLPKVMKRGPVK